MAAGPSIQEEMQEKSPMEVIELSDKCMLFNAPEGAPPVRQKENHYAAFPHPQ